MTVSKDISLPKITPEIYKEHKSFIDGDMDWTQEAVDFACLIAGSVLDINKRLQEQLDIAKAKLERASVVTPEYKAQE